MVHPRLNDMRAGFPEPANKPHDTDWIRNPPSIPVTKGALLDPVSSYCMDQPLSSKSLGLKIAFCPCPREIYRASFQLPHAQAH